uniref:Uncharacterized protein n=1 Tax=Melopsittacus undulatus TaxID=13146 RepID=A0A8V5FYN0_MELUD
PHGSHHFLPQVSGAVLVSGLVQLVLGVSGVCGWAAQHCGPMVLAPSLSIIGLSAYKEAAFFCSTNWVVALLYVGFPLPLRCKWGILMVHGTCLVSHHRDGAWWSVLPLLGSCFLLSPSPSTWDLAACPSVPGPRLGGAPWSHLCPPCAHSRYQNLYPPAPSASPSFLSQPGSSVMNSVGCYVLCGRLLRAPQLSPDACNRGLCTEGLGSLLAGLLGAPGGTATSIANTCAAGLTQVWLGLGGGSARDGEAMEQEGWVTCSTQAVTRSSLGKAGLYGGGGTGRDTGHDRVGSDAPCPHFPVLSTRLALASRCK